MSRIDINIEEYNGLKNKIKQLDATLADVSKEASKYKEMIETLKVLVMDLENEPLFDRIFKWKSVIKPFKSVFQK